MKTIEDRIDEGEFDFNIEPPSLNLSIDDLQRDLAIYNDQFWEMRDRFLDALCYSALLYDNLDQSQKRLIRGMVNASWQMARHFRPEIPHREFLHEVVYHLTRTFYLFTIVEEEYMNPQKEALAILKKTDRS
jgi:hypothetical protein